jgi:hypothetical protein
MSQSVTECKDLRYPAWQPVYAAVLMEFDLPKLFKLVEIAEASLLVRRDLLDNRPQAHAECHAIQNALQKLAVIKRERLKFMNEDS